MDLARGVIFIHVLKTSLSSTHVNFGPDTKKSVVVKNKPMNVVVVKNLIGLLNINVIRPIDCS